MSKILLVEDNIDFSNMLRQYLEINAFEVQQSGNGVEALELLSKESFDICILDVMMPKMDGFTLAEEIREKWPTLPFIFLTARKLKEDRIKGLSMADDYIAKPFEAEELVLRLNNILRRSQATITKETNTQEEDFTSIQIGEYTFDKKNLQLISPTTTHRLTEKETALLHYLVVHRNKVIKRADIMNQFWEENDFFSRRSMNVFISRLRKYLKEDESIQIESLRGVGLIFKIQN